MPTEGEPAIVGNWLRLLRSDASDCFCKELIVCEVALVLDVEGVRVMLDVDEDAEVAFTFASRSAVEEGKAVSCIGGKTIGFGFF